MIAAIDLAHWLDSLPAGSNVAIDDGGLTLVRIGGDAHIEIGGVPLPEQAPRVTCGICEWQGPETALRCTLTGIPDLFSRIEVGGEVPAGECPECGGLCYLENNEMAHVCAGCAKLIMRGEGYQFAQDKYFHPGCYASERALVAQAKGSGYCKDCGTAYENHNLCGCQYCPKCWLSCPRCGGHRRDGRA